LVGERVKNNVLLLWSGGADSTVALLRLLRESPTIRVRTLSIQHPQFAARKEQLAARNLIQERLKSAQSLTFDRLEVEIRHSADAGLDGAACQAATWLSIGQGYLAPNEDLALGYMATDSIWHTAEQLRQAFAALQAAQRKDGQLQFPTEWDERPEILSALDEWGLTDLCWWCERPEVLPLAAVSAEFIKQERPLTKACGTCHPCEEHAAGRWLLSMRADRRARGS
jgi:7-cyano-7-deazaguanine synthase in queuosine biosynthesis